MDICILEQSGFVGSSYEIHLCHKEIVLTETDTDGTGPYALFGNRTRAIELAREHVRCILGDEAAESARFSFARGNKL